MAKLTTIFTSLNLQELYIAQGILDSEGVETFIKNELINQTVPYLNMNNLIELQVRDQQIDEAVLILQNAGYLKPVISKKKSQAPGSAQPAGSDSAIRNQSHSIASRNFRALY